MSPNFSPVFMEGDVSAIRAENKDPWEGSFSVFRIRGSCPAQAPLWAHELSDRPIATPREATLVTGKHRAAPHCVELMSVLPVALVWLCICVSIFN